MKRSKLIEISTNDITIGSIVDNGDIIAVLKKTTKEELYYEVRKDTILPAYSHFLGIK